MKVLVTGADGLLGNNLVRELLDRQDSVRALVQPGRTTDTLDGLAVERISGDLLAADGSLAETLAGCEAVFHCAAITDQWAEPGLVWKVNFEGTKNLLAAMQEAGVKKLAFTGSASSCQFGSLDRPGDESGPFPAAYQGIAYMESKHAAANLVREHVKDRGLHAVILLPTFMLGPHDPGPSSGELVRQFIARRLRFTTAGGRNFAHVRDVAGAMATALEKGKNGEQYLLGGANLAYQDFFARVAGIAGTEPPRWVIPAAAVLAAGVAGSLFEKVSGRRALMNLRLARLSLLGTYYRPDKAIRELGLKQTPIEQAIEECIESLKHYGHIKPQAGTPAGGSGGGT